MSFTTTLAFLTYEHERITAELIICRKQYAFLDTADCGEPIPNLVEELTNYQDAIDKYCSELRYVSEQLDFFHNTTI
jgi:hypothetical protein